MIDTKKIIDKLNEHNRIITDGSKEEIVEYAKQYNIHQDSESEHYVNTCTKIRARLKYYGLDPDNI